LRIVIFGPDRRVGGWEGDLVVDLNQAWAALHQSRGTPGDAQANADERVPSELVRLIDRGPAGLDDARTALEFAVATGGDELVHERCKTVLHPPAVSRPRIACAANNYAGHTLGSVSARAGASAALPSAAMIAAGVGSTTVPRPEQIVTQTRAAAEIRGFWKDFADPSGPEGEVPYPGDATLFDYEGEVAVVLGKRTKGVSASQSRDCVWGVTLHNDLSIRSLHAETGAKSFHLSKNFERSASVGPSIFVGEFDLQDIEVETRVNGEVRQRYNSRDMIFSFGEFIEHLSRNLVLLPGDMISGGSGAGSAIDSATLRPGGKIWPDDLDTRLFLSVGDTVEVSTPQIGTLRNRIVESTS
jgi:acylpyruvate hydrolase